LEIPYGLGRIEALDERDYNYLVRSAFASPPRPRERRLWWADGWWGDQGRTSACVAFAWTHWLEDGPIGQPNITIDPLWLYREAQRVDEIPGEEPQVKGTTVRAGAKVLVRLGLVKSYHWAFRIEDVIHAVLYLGPVVAGTRWFMSMFEPDRRGWLRVREDRVRHQHMGHAYVINGVDVKEGWFRIKNSWGRRWGVGGHAYIAIEDFERLLSLGGEVCIASEQQAPPKPRD